MRSRQQNRKPIQSQIEHLETRTLMAGDVITSVAGDMLVVRGDELDNHISIEAGEDLNSYVITGLPDANGDATTVNGKDSVIVKDVSRGIRAGMSDGNDSVNLQSVQVDGNLIINGGPGNDQLKVTGSTISRNAVLRLGQGEDTAHIGGSKIDGNLIISGRPHQITRPPHETEPTRPPEGTEPTPVPCGGRVGSTARRNRANPTTTRDGTDSTARRNRANPTTTRDGTDSTARRNRANPTTTRDGTDSTARSEEPFEH